MKVIQDNWSSARFIFPFKKTCPNCTSALEVEEGDVQGKKGQNQFEVTYSYFTITCPLCKHESMVEPQRR